MEKLNGYITNSADKYFNQYTVNRAFIIETVKKYTYYSWVYCLAEENFGASEFEKYQFLYTEHELRWDLNTGTAKNYFWAVNDYNNNHTLMVTLKMFDYLEMFRYRDYLALLMSSINKIEEKWERDWAIYEPLLIEFIDMRAERRNQQILAQKNENNNS